MNLSHVHIQALSVDESVKFYTENLGFRELGRQEGIAFLRDENGLDFVIDPSPSGDPIPSSVHIGFRRQTPEEVAEAYEELKDRVEICQPLVENDGFTLFSMKDPNDMMVEVFYSAL